MRSPRWGQRFVEKSTPCPSRQFLVCHGPTVRNAPRQCQLISELFSGFQLAIENAAGMHTLPTMFTPAGDVLIGSDAVVGDR